MCCSPWGRKGLDTTERLNSNKNSVGGEEKKVNIFFIFILTTI